MENELRRNPDTGDVERKVVVWEREELSQIETEVTNQTNEVENLTSQVEAAKANVTDLETRLSAAESALASAKSRLEAYQAVAQPSETDNDAGAEVVESGVATEEEVINTTENEVVTPQF